VNDALDAALLAAHARGDRDALIGLYAQAADGAEAAGHADAAWFFRTQAYVFALDRGIRARPRFTALLTAAGREA
jgi:hypothetical protein